MKLILMTLYILLKLIIIKEYKKHKILKKWMKIKFVSEIIFLRWDLEGVKIC